jgi:hypothetical protein
MFDFSVLHLFFPRFAARLKYFSHRAESGFAVRMMGVVGREVTEFPLPEADL